VVSMCLFSGILGLCLVCLEIPEMSALNDDTSNDFTFLRATSANVTVVVAARAAETGAGASSSIAAAVPLQAPAFESPPELAPRDLLALHSSWRT
jgi:hypothetical protein